jgi:hypothetical protein
VELESSNEFELAEIDVQSTAHTVQAGVVTPAIDEEIIYGYKVEYYAGAFQGGPLATPVAEQVWLIVPGL